MDTQSLRTALLTFHDDHPFLTALILVTYVSVVFIYTLFLLAHLKDPRTIPWLPPIVLTDGILICCCPLAAIAPILLWPLVLAVNVLLASLRWFCLAPTFCGVRREAFFRPCRACAGKLHRWWRDRWGRKREQTLLPVTNGVPEYSSWSGYGAINEWRTQSEWDHGSSPTNPDTPNTTDLPSCSDIASESSAPPPYHE